jgi:hypothetical protein
LTIAEKRQQLDTLLATYNLTRTVHFPTRIQNSSATAIDNIFIDITRNGNYAICPLVNGLSDHDAQIMKLNNINVIRQSSETKTLRNFNKYSITEFQIKLSYDNIFGENDVNTIFNNFLNTYLRIFNSRFTKKIQFKRNGNTWMTKGMKTSCVHKRELYMNCRNSNGIKLKEYYKLYCKILSKVIKA